MKGKFYSALAILTAAAMFLGESGVRAAEPPSVQAAGGTGNAAETGTPGSYLLAEDVDPEQFLHLNVGVSTPLSGSFFTNMWGRATSDEDIRNLLHGYDLIRWNGGQGMFEPDPAVVKTLNVLENTEGDRSYVFTLMDDLRFSDGSRITARDYAFSILLGMAPEITELGGIPEDRSFVLGAEAYLSGETKSLAGVRILSDDMLMITVSHEYLPFFYELGRLTCIPYPIGVIAPGVAVLDDGDGAYLANEVEDADGDGTPDEPLFTAALLQETILDPDTGYMAHPTVVSGPYRMESWDGTTAELVRNEAYNHYTGYTLQVPAGTGENGETVYEERFVPYIESLSVSYVSADDAMQKLDDGELDLVNKVTRADVIQNGMLMMRDRESGEREISMTNYPRTGLGYISFACEREELTQNVRKALALCMDRDAVVADYTGGFGQRTDSFCGIGQWMYGLVAGTTLPPVNPPENENDAEAQAAYEKEQAAWAEVNLDGLDPYATDLEAAKGLLAADGWEMNEETGILEKKIPLTEEEIAQMQTEESAGDAEPGAEKYRTISLDLTLAIPTDVDIEESLQKNWVPNLEKAGIRLNLVKMEFQELIRLFYGWDDRSDPEVDMFFRATNFDVLFDPAVYFSIEENAAEGGEPVRTWGYTNLEDEELYRLAEEMRSTEPGDILGYMQKWVSFQERFNDLLPVLPLYSNVYFDFYTAELHNYNAATHISWSDSILEARYYREAEPEEEAAESESPAETESGTETTPAA